MAKIQKFEDLQSWQKARELANTVFELTRHEKFSHDFELKDQIRRASGSAMHNIAEGFDAGSDVEFRRFLRIARRSASEVQSELYLALDAGYIDEGELTKTYDIAMGVKKLINGMLAYLKQQDVKSKN